MVLSKPDQIKVVDKEVEALPSKGAICQVSMTSPGQVFCILVVLIKDSVWRSIIYLKWLNKEFSDLPHFQMDLT